MSEYMRTTRPGDRDTGQVGRQEGQQVAGAAQEAASNVAETAGERARGIKDQAGSHVRGIAGQASQQLQQHARQETERAGGALRQAGDRLQALADGNVDDAGVFAEYTRDAAERVSRWAEAVETRGLDGLLDDMRSYGRRRPGMFVLGALAAGVVVGRFGRNLRNELSEGDAEQATPAQQLPAQGIASERTDEIAIPEPVEAQRGSTA